MSMALIALIVLVLFIGLILLGVYNRLVSLRQNVNQGEADIDAQLRMRNDLIPNLVETVKGYAAHEKSTLDAVIAARNSAMTANGAAAQAAAEGQLSGALKNLFALAENYPDLKANSNFQELQKQLTYTEEMLAAARRAYNSVVADYNGAIEHFPAVLFAGMLGCKPRAFHRLSEAEAVTMGQPPAVKF